MYVLDKMTFEILSEELRQKAFAIDFLKAENIDVPPEAQDEYNRLLEIYSMARIKKNIKSYELGGINAN